MSVVSVSLSDQVSVYLVCRGKDLYSLVKRNGKEGSVACRVPPPEENLVIMNSTNNTGVSIHPLCCYRHYHIFPTLQKLSTALGWIHVSTLGYWFSWAFSLARGSVTNSSLQSW